MALLLVAAPAGAEVRLPSVFSEHAVLQRDRPIPVWGWAEPGERVTVEIATQSRTTTADAQGRWEVRLDPLPGGGPYAMSVSGTNRLRIDDVLIGEVWLCSGQSNMAMSVGSAKNAEREIAAARWPRIRLMTVSRTPADTPQDECRGLWAPCGPETVGDFSAVGYYFGRELHRELDVPVGLILSAYGGTPAESWTSRTALEADPALRSIVRKWEKSIAAYDPNAARARYEAQMQERRQAAERARAEGRTAPRIKLREPVHPAQNPRAPTTLFNGMIHPMIPFAVRGVIWYQGESNVERAFEYRTLFPAMIRDWRDAWEVPDLPFYFVQIAPYRYRIDPRACPELWESQLLTMRSVPNTGMAVITDAGNADNIHPKDKQVVGHRLALWALSGTYGRDGLVCSGPIYREMRVEGDRAVIRFDHTGSGLTSGDGHPLTEFTLAGPDQAFHPAEARIDGDAVVVRCEKVPRPVAVRFAWRDTAEPNLVNNEGLPASPFRTDDWPAVTQPPMKEDTP